MVYIHQHVDEAPDLITTVYNNYAPQQSILYSPANTEVTVKSGLNLMFNFNVQRAGEINSGMRDNVYDAGVTRSLTSYLHPCHSGTCCPVHTVFLQRGPILRRTSPVTLSV